MAQNFQSSFIPKEPVTQEVFKKKKAGMLGVLAVSLFFTSLIVAGGLYVYKGILKNDIKDLQSELAEAERNIDKKTINEMSQFGKKLDFVKSIVAKHRVVSNFLDSLASSTVSAVQFKEFTYGDMENGSLPVKLTGKATSYAAVALQEHVFSQNEYFDSMEFSNLSLGEKGLVGFELAILINPQMSVYSP